MRRIALPAVAALAALLAATASAQTLLARAMIAAGAPALSHLVHENHAGAVQASGTVNTVDLVGHTVNLSHGSIKALGWPAMTMDFPVGADVDLAALKPGTRVNFTLVHGSGGMLVDAIRPAAKDGR